MQTIEPQVAAPLKVLNQALAKKLALGNQVARFLRQNDCRLLDMILDGPQPLLRVTQPNRLLLTGFMRGLMLVRLKPGVTHCRAYLLGCEIEWTSFEEVVH